MAKRNDPVAAGLRKLPSVDALLRDPDLEDSAAKLGRTVVVNSIRQAIEALREQLSTQGDSGLDEEAIRQRIVADVHRRLKAMGEPYYRRVVNATGIILHTALGRAVLPRQVLQQIQDELSGYSLLQADTETGKRSKRDAHIEQLLRQLTGAEAATVVNNNAAATSIVLNTVAKGRQVIVSRGQLVEIGGSFRLPDVMAFSGAKLIEVGTTNKTHARDYVNAITENTAAILRVHPSNYKIRGFTSEVPLSELVEITHSRGLVMIDDVGAGALIDFSQFGFEPEPTLAESIRAGADIVTCSADKLIGASQGGIILGKASLIDAIRKNQFARIVRVGKLTLAALEATLKLFLDESLALREVPTLRMLRRDTAEIAKHASRLASRIGKAVPGIVVSTVPGFSQMGSGSLPDQDLPTTLVALRCEKLGAESLAAQLRWGGSLKGEAFGDGVSRPSWPRRAEGILPSDRGLEARDTGQPQPVRQAQGSAALEAATRGTPVFTRIQNDQVLIDPRTLCSGDDKIILEALIEILGGIG